MTLKEYGPSYAEWTDPELEQAIDNRIDVRGITPMLNRKTMIRALQEADRIATFRFHDLPAELRNRIYEDLFQFRPSKWHSESKACHAAILGTCKEVNNEARGYLNDEREAQIRLIIRTRELRMPRGSRQARYPWESQSRFPLATWNSHYGLDVEFNGVAIFGTTNATTSYNWLKVPKPEIRWPPLLSRVRSITLKLDMEGTRFHGILSLFPSDGKRVNHALHQLGEFLRKDCKATALNVEISSTLRAGGSLNLRTTFSPLCSLASKFPDYALNLTGLPDTLQTELKDTATGFKKVHAVMREAAHLRENETWAWCHLRGELKDCTDVVTPEWDGQMWIHAGSGTVKLAAVQLEDAIRKRPSGAEEGLPPYVIGVIKRKQEIKAATNIQVNVESQDLWGIRLLDYTSQFAAGSRRVMA